MSEEIWVFHMRETCPDLALTTSKKALRDPTYRKCALNCRFPLEKRAKPLQKTNDPGPGSYHVHDTVGVIAEFNRYEVHPRESQLVQKD